MSRIRNALLGLTLAASLGALVSTQAQAACLRAPALLSEAEMTAFLGAPELLLERHPDGGVMLARDVRGLVGSDIALLDAVIALAEGANEAQRTAIGFGLAQAAQACIAASIEDPSAADLAELIQLAVVSLGDEPLLIAFLSGSNGTLTAARGPGPGPAAGFGGTGGVTGGGVSGIGLGAAISATARDFVQSIPNPPPPGFIGGGGRALGQQIREIVREFVGVPSPTRPGQS